MGLAWEKDSEGERGKYCHQDNHMPLEGLGRGISLYKHFREFSRLIRAWEDGPTELGEQKDGGLWNSVGVASQRSRGLRGDRLESCRASLMFQHKTPGSHPAASTAPSLRVPTPPSESLVSVDPRKDQQPAPQRLRPHPAPHPQPRPHLPQGPPARFCTSGPPHPAHSSARVPAPAPSMA